MKVFTAIICLLLIGSCATFRPYQPGASITQAPTGNIQQSIFSLSGKGDAKVNDPAVVQVLRDHLAASGDKAILLGLGNFGLRSGYPDSSNLKSQVKYNEQMEPIIRLLRNMEGTYYLIPGLNEWSNGRRRGLGRVRGLEAKLKQYLDQDNFFLPGDGCPGPVEVPINDETVLLVIDTQWWFQSQTEDDGAGCEIRGKGDFLVALNDAVRRNYNKQLIVAGFHPLYSNGPASGYYPASKHLKPPVIGSIHAFYKRTIGDDQDISNFSYKIFAAIVRRSLRNHPNAIYLSAKERSMQYWVKDDVHMIISGSAAPPQAVAAKEGPLFAHARSGFTRIDQYDSGEVWLEFWGADENGKAELAYRRLLYTWVPPEQEEAAQDTIDFTGQTITALATEKHRKKKNKKGLTGLNYRAEWESPIAGVRVFDIGREKGGLEIIKKGGGMQTRSLRLEDTTGRQWVLRSIEKYPANALPPELRGTYADDLITDQVSASHPYGALVIPKMAAAVNVYHTNPELVYLPDDPRLGIYQSDFGEGLYLHEERPAKEVWEDAAHFGKPDDIISSLDLIEKMTNDGDHRVDEPHAIRSRLFDIVIGDWDRHDDQWRWAKYNKARKYDEKIDLYRPIPRDRDQAFFLGDGALLEFGSHKWGQPKFQGFKHQIRDVEGLAFNARYFDRYFITESDWEVWKKEAQFIKENLTDEVIEEAIKGWPPEIYALNGEEIISKLKQRRDEIPLYANKIYAFVSKDVNVLGTDKADRFEIERMEDGRTRVSVYRVKANKRDIKGKYYERIFTPDVTKEIRLYGLGGKDEFEFIGEAKKGIKVRTVGGSGEDQFLDQSKVAGLAKKTLIYDNKTGTTITRSSETSVRTSDKDASVNKYDRREFKYDVLAPKFFGGYNPDDFILIGGGITWTKHGFRKEPFQNRHSFVFDIGTRSASFNFLLTNEFNRVIGKWDLVSRLSISEPSFADFFYGFGNGTTVNEARREDDSQYYRARYSRIRFAPTLRRRWKDDKHTLNIGVFFDRINVESEDNANEGPPRFIFRYDSLRQTQGFNLLDRARIYGGGLISYRFDNTDNAVVPTRGFRFNLIGAGRGQIGDEDSLNNAQYQSNLSFYFTVGKAGRVTLATRIGGIMTSGEFEFYHAARLGGLNNLRGHRRLRFAGTNAVYQNNDIRIKLFDMRSKLLIGPVGINLLADFGKMWANDLPVEATLDRERWHYSVGGGLWMAPFKSVVINLDYTKSLSLKDESGVPFLRFGFFF